MDTVNEKSKYIGVFLDILFMTRTITEFKKWNSKAVSKSFKWADIILRMGGEIFFLRQYLRPIGIDFVDIDTTVVLTEPHETLLKCILSSPFMRLLPDAESVVHTSLLTCSNYIGKQRTVDVSSRIIGQAVSFQHIWIGVSDNEQYEITNLSIAFEFVMVLWSVARPDDHTTPVRFDQLIISKLKASCASDPISFNYLCRALVLPLVWIDFYLTSRLASLSRPCTAADVVETVCKSDQLWEVVDDVVRENISLFLSLEDRLLEQVCDKRPQLGLDVLTSVILEESGRNKDLNYQQHANFLRIEKLLKHIYRRHISAGGQFLFHST